MLDAGASFCPFCGQKVQLAPTTIGAGAQLELGWGKVVVGDVLGEGGMGVVHRGWLYYDPRGPYGGTPSHPVAVKALHAALSSRPQLRALFEGEAEALARLKHPNVVHFLALVPHGEQLAIVLELVDGEPLSALIERHVGRARPGGIPALPFVRAWHYFSQLLGALASTHALGILHRDVKPSNVLIRHDGLVKLTDYGIARLPETSGPGAGGSAPGTGAYMAPEQVLGGELDARSDLYAAAIVLWEMLTGHTPFDAPDRDELMVRTAQLEEPAPALTSVVPQAPPVLDMLFARALAKDRMHRFSSAVELGEAFRKALGLPESEGWLAQQRMARHADDVSRWVARAPEPARDSVVTRASAVPPPVVMPARPHAGAGPTPIAASEPRRRRPVLHTAPLPARLEDDDVAAESRRFGSEILAAYRG